MTTESDDRDLVERTAMLGVPGGTPLAMRALSQLIVNLKNALVGQSEAATELNRRIERLSTLLLWVTVVMCALALIQAGSGVVQGIAAWKLLIAR